MHTQTRSNDIRKTCKNKRCFWPQPRPISEFNKSSFTEDGLQAYCRECQSESNRKQRTKFPTLARDKRKEQRLKDPLMYNALRRIRYRVSQGTLIRGNCDVCGQTKHVRAYLSHHSSTDPRWFCQAHHPNRSGGRHA